MHVSSGRPHMLVSNQRGRGQEPVTVLGSIRSRVTVKGMADSLRHRSGLGAGGSGVGKPLVISGNWSLRSATIASKYHRLPQPRAPSREPRLFAIVLSSGTISASMASSTQKLAVVLAFIAAALSFAAVVVGYVQTGTIRITPLGGGALMLALGISGYKRISAPRA